MIRLSYKLRDEPQYFGFNFISAATTTTPDRTTVSLHILLRSYQGGGEPHVETQSSSSSANLLATSSIVGIL